MVTAADDLTLLPVGADAEGERGQVEVVVRMWRWTRGVVGAGDGEEGAEAAKGPGSAAGCPGLHPSTCLLVDRCLADAFLLCGGTREEQKADTFFCEWIKDDAGKLGNLPRIAPPT
jgi:hypothetical protein